MDNWSFTEWLTALIAIGSSAIGILFWIHFLRLPPELRFQFGRDNSVAAGWGLVDVLVVVFAWLFSQAIAFQILSTALGSQPGAETVADQSARMGLLIGFVQLVVVSLSLAYLSRRYKHEERDFGLAHPQWGSGIRAGLIGFVMWVPVVWVVQTALVSFVDYSHPSFDRVQQSDNPRTLIDTWITAVLFAPIVEEVLFRGILQGWLQRLSPQSPTTSLTLITGNTLVDEQPSGKRSATAIYWPAIVLTSILFGLAHFSQGPAPVSLFVLSLGLGYLYQRTGSLIACIVMHMMLNAITMTLFTINLYSA